MTRDNFANFIKKNLFLKLVLLMFFFYDDEDPKSDNISFSIPNNISTYLLTLYLLVLRMHELMFGKPCAFCFELQVLIAILYCNPPLLFAILEKLQESVPNASIAQHFIKQWIHDTDCFMG